MCWRCLYVFLGGEPFHIYTVYTYRRSSQRASAEYNWNECAADEGHAGNVNAEWRSVPALLVLRSIISAYLDIYNGHRNNQHLCLSVFVM